MEFNSSIKLTKGPIDVVAIGEVLVDMISNEYSEDFENASFYTYFGGSPANIAVNLANLGHNSGIISNLGDDMLGKPLLDMMNRNGVNTEGVTMDTKNSTSLVLVSKSKANPSFISYRGADKNLTITDIRLEQVRASKIVHFTSWPISHSPGRETVLRLIDEAKKNGAIVSFDPNYREVLWETGHNGPEFVKSLLSRVDIVKPSEDDAKNLFEEDTHEGYIERFLKLGVKLVILTIGKEGLMASNGKELIKVPSMATEVVDTTGAGDAFWSGFYSGILRGKTINEAIKTGSAVSAYKLKRVGAIAGLPRIGELEKIYNI